MTTQQQFADGFARMEAATTTIAERIRALTEKVATGGMSDAEEQAVLAQFNGVADALEAMGKDPANPVPVEPPPAQP